MISIALTSEKEMFYRNESDFPDKELMIILHFADPHNFLQRQGEIVIKNRDKGDPYGEHVQKEENDWPKITIYKEKDDTAIHLVLYLTHEFRHMWQNGFCSFLYDVSDKRIAEMAERMMEEDAHAYDLAIMRVMARESMELENTAWL